MNSPPGNANAPLAKGRREKLTGLTQSNSGVSISQACKHRATVTQQEPPGATHFSSEICLNCGAFVRWLPKPSTIERRTLNSFRLARLGMCEGLSPWQRRFVRDVSQQRKLSPKQQQIIDRLCADYLEWGRAS